MVTKLFYFSLASHRSAPRPQTFHVGNLLGFVGFGVFCTLSVLMLSGSLVDVFGVASIEASVNALQDINVERHVILWLQCLQDVVRNNPFLHCPLQIRFWVDLLNVGSVDIDDVDLLYAGVANFL